MHIQIELDEKEFKHEVEYYINQINMHGNEEKFKTFLIQRTKKTLNLREKDTVYVEVI